MTAATGGFKTVLNTDTQQTYRDTFSGSSNIKTVVVTFDLEPPKHCSVIDNCTADNNVPIDVGREIDNNVSKIIRTQIIYMTVQGHVRRAT